MNEEEKKTQQAERFYLTALYITLTEIVNAHDDVSNWERQSNAVKHAKKLLSPVEDFAIEGLVSGEKDED